MELNSYHINALKYVHNTNGGAKVFHFIEDHEPIGLQLWTKLLSLDLVCVQNEYIFLTDKGKNILPL